MDRVKRAPGDLALHIALEEALLVIVKELVTIEAIGERSKAAA